MALIDEVKALFENDVKFGDWSENAKVDDANPNKIEIRFYTDSNEYVLTVSTAEDNREPVADAIVNARKPRAGETAVRSRRIWPAGQRRLNMRTWHRLMASIFGLELVRVQRRESAGTTARAA